MSELRDEILIEDASRPKEELPLVQFSHVYKNFGEKEILSDLSFGLMKGHVIGLLGPNGAGKTTILKMLAALSHPKRGKIRIDGEDVGTRTKAKVSYIPSTDLLDGDETLSSAGEFFKNYFDDFDENSFNDLCQSWSLPEGRLGKMSEGQRKRVFLALGLSRKAELFLLDEPLEGLDPIGRDQLMDLLLDLIDSRATFIISTSRVRDLEQIFDDVIFLKGGEIVKMGSAEALRLDEGMSMDQLYKEIYYQEAL